MTATLTDEQRNALALAAKYFHNADLNERLIITEPEAHTARFTVDTVRSGDRAERSRPESGHWGVPLMVFRGEPFFGQDRIDVLLWRMKQAGLSERRP